MTNSIVKHQPAAYSIICRVSELDDLMEPLAPNTELMRKIEERSAPEKKASLKRRLGSKSVQVTLDSVGRICLPDEMAKATGITKDAVLVGLLDRFEIWSPERFEKVTASDEIMAQEAFKMME